MLLADYAEYIKAQERVGELYKVKYKNKKEKKKDQNFDYFRIQLNGRKNVY